MLYSRTVLCMKMKLQLLAVCLGLLTAVSVFADDTLNQPEPNGGAQGPLDSPPPTTTPIYEPQPQEVPQEVPQPLPTIDSQ